MTGTWRFNALCSSVLDQWVQEYLGDIGMTHCGEYTILHGKLQDICALYGLIIRLRDAEIPIREIHAVNM